MPRVHKEGAQASETTNFPGKPVSLFAQKV